MSRYQSFNLPFWKLRAVLICCLWLLPLGSFAQQAEHAAQPTADNEAATETDKDQEYYQLMRLFVDSFDQIERNYVQEIDRRELIEAAIDGMLKKLDQYSDYIPPQEVEQFQGSVDGEFAGIGIQVSIEDGFLRVISPMYGSPAYHGGVLAGDMVLKINNLDAEGISMDDAVKLIKGKTGTKVRLKVRHVADQQEEEFELVREVVQVQTVLGYHRNDDDSWNYFYNADEKIGYIRLTSFARRSAAELQTAVEQLQARGMQGLILDLRNNPGGLLPVAIKVCDMFVPEGKIVSTRGRNSASRQWDAHKEGTFQDFPMGVLVNGFSASASEIVAACLKDNNRAVLVGERTFGKGSVQNVISLEEGTSILKLTTSAYYRPNGKNINRLPNSKETDDWGVQPSEGFEVKLDAEQTLAYMKDRRQRDIVAKKPASDDKANQQGQAKGPEGKFEDQQLNKALDYIRTQIKSRQP